jgi:hypothetical protein
MRKATTHKDY